jgi:hypothetical protein
MKKVLLIASILLSSLPAYSQSIYRSTTCNVYYNNMGRVFEGVDCKVWFSNQRLTHVKVYLPHAKRWYDWSTKHSNVTPDPRWKECIRHTGKEGNQYQICTQQSPEQLKV